MLNYGMTWLLTNGKIAQVSGGWPVVSGWHAKQSDQSKAVQNGYFEVMSLYTPRDTTSWLLGA